MLKYINIIKKVVCIVAITFVAVFLAAVIFFNAVFNGESEKAKVIFATTFLETGQLKFVANLFLNSEEINLIINDNSLENMTDEIDSDLINFDNSENQDSSIIIEEIETDYFYATIMIVSDPSTVSLATSYPWSEYGLELEELVENSGAIAGVNGGLYISDLNKSGNPLGVVVCGGEIQYLDSSGIDGLHLIGLDNNNILQIIDLSGMDDDDIKELIIDLNIRDAVSFVEESTDDNSSFVKLIINGEKRVLNGIGSGYNPRTAIGQLEDGSIIFVVTDGRGFNGHLGATASDLIEILYDYGAVNAANLDGGSSSQMYYNNEYLMPSVTFYYVNSSWRIPTAFVIKGN